MAYLTGYEECLITAQGDGSALTNTTTATSILPGQAKATLFPQQLEVPGRHFRVRASGRISSAASSPGNITLDIRFGSIIVATTQAIALATSQTNITWRIDWDLTLRAVGASTSANFMHTGEAKSAAFSGGPLILIPASAPVVGTGFDSTVSNVVDFFATFSALSASNSITLHQFVLERVA